MGQLGVSGFSHGCLLTALFCTFLAPFFNRWSDKKVQKVKKFGKGNISIPRIRGILIPAPRAAKLFLCSLNRHEEKFVK